MKSCEGSQVPPASYKYRPALKWGGLANQTPDNPLALITLYTLISWARLGIAKKWSSGQDNYKLMDWEDRFID